MFLFILIFLFQLINSQEKFCVNCRHFKGNLFSDKFSTCKLFPLIEKEYDEADYLVTGKQNTKHYYYCTTARKFDTMCGLEGKYYDKKCSIFNTINNKLNQK